MVALFFYGTFRIWKKVCKNTCYKLFAIISFALLPSSHFILHLYFALFCQTTICEMPLLNRIEKDTCHNCGTQTTRKNLYATRRVVLLVHCIAPTFPNSPQNPKMIWITILLKNTALQNPMSPSSVNFIIKSFQDFTLYVNKETLNTECKSDHEQGCGCGTYSGRCWRSQVERRVAVYSIFLGWHRTWKGETQTIQLRSANSQQHNRERETWFFFNNLKCAAKVNLASGFILKNIEDGGFRYFYLHENNTLLDRSKLVCTHDDLAKLKRFFNKTDVNKSCSRERMNTKWRFYKLTNLTIFAVLLKDVPAGCKDAVLPESLLENHTINCLTFEENKRQPNNDNQCLFYALALPLQGYQRLE